MSHFKEREEKNCLNCQSAVQGRYCHVCGQENIDPKENFWHLVTHFVYDIMHYDGKFFSTLRYLLFKPGFLSHEYLKGRRASYLHPIRMYVFTSAIFFLIFFSTRSEDDGVMKMNDSGDTVAEIMKDLEKDRKRYAARINDSISGERKAYLLSRIALIDSDFVLIQKDTTVKNKLKSRQNESNFLGGSEGLKYKTIAAYDSAQARLPKDQRDNFIERKLTRQNIYLKEKYKDDEKAMWKAIISKFNHLFPQMLFVSLPLFALILKLLYVRRQKFYYVNHVIFTIHLYCGTFILILAGMALNGLFKLVHLDLSGWIGFLFWLLGLFYWYKNMRRFYEQGRGKTILKYTLALFLSLIMMSLIFAVFFIFSAMTI